VVEAQDASWLKLRITTESWTRSEVLLHPAMYPVERPEMLVETRVSVTSGALGRWSARSN